MYDGFMECNECGHVERFFHPLAGLMSMQSHCEEEHGISEEEFIEQMEDAAEELQ